MSAQEAAQLGAMAQLMEVMDAFDEENRKNRAKRRRTVQSKPWLLLRDNPRCETKPLNCAKIVMDLSLSEKKYLQL